MTSALQRNWEAEIAALLVEMTETGKPSRCEAMVKLTEEDDGKWVPVTVAEQSEDGMCSVSVIGYPEIVMPPVPPSELRPVQVPTDAEGSMDLDINDPDLDVGMPVRALFLEDRGWYEAEVLQVFNDEGYVSVLFVEYGDIQNTCIEHVRKSKRDRYLSGMGQEGGASTPRNSESVFEMDGGGASTAAEDFGVDYSEPSMEAATQPLSTKDYSYFHELSLIGVPKAALIPAMEAQGLSYEGFEDWQKHEKMRQTEQLNREMEKAAKMEGQERAAMSEDRKMARNILVSQLSSEHYFGKPFLRQCFQQFDRDGDGRISVVEFVKAVNKTSNDLARVAIQIFSRMDTERTGSLTQEKFVDGFRTFEHEPEATGVRALLWCWRTASETYYSLDEETKHTRKRSETLQALVDQREAERVREVKEKERKNSLMDNKIEMAAIRAGENVHLHQEEGDGEVDDDEWDD